MAQVSSNPLITGWSGKFGDTLVFRTLRGKTFVSATPRKPDKRKESDAQRKTRSTFKEAAAWARHVLQDPEKKTYYRFRAKALKLPNAYTAAITDYMRKPKVLKMTEANREVITVSKPGFAMTSVRVVDSEGAQRPTVVRRADGWLVIVPGSGASSDPMKLQMEDAAGRTTEVLVPR
jgi:hypothetical protein